MLCINKKFRVKLLSTVTQQNHLLIKKLKIRYKISIRQVYRLFISQTQDPIISRLKIIENIIGILLFMYFLYFAQISNFKPLQSLQTYFKFSQLRNPLSCPDKPKLSKSSIIKPSSSLPCGYYTRSGQVRCLGLRNLEQSSSLLC